MAVKTLSCPSCGAPLKSTDTARCQYCGSVLVYSVQEQVFRAINKEGVYGGIARNVQQRQENSDTVLTFRIEQLDHEGNVLDYIPVELRQPRIKGILVDGDEVEVSGKLDKDGILLPQRILNLTTRASITKSSSNLGTLLFLLPFLFGVLGFVGAGGAFEGAITGFIAGGFLTVFLFILSAAVKR